MIQSKTLDKAYCKELGRVVTTAEVWHLIFEENYPEKKLNFQCPHFFCSAMLVKKQFTAHGGVGNARFRLHQHERHAEDCPYRRPEHYSKKSKQKKKPYIYYGDL